MALHWQTAGRMVVHLAYAVAQDSSARREEITVPKSIDSGQAAWQAPHCVHKNARSLPEAAYSDLARSRSW